MSQAVPILGFGLDGRMGRLSYATVCAFGTAALLLPSLPLVTSPTTARFAIYAVLVLALLGLGVRWTALRLHDMGVSGWWGVLLLLPYVGFIASLAFSLLPGTSGDNDHGPRPDSGNWFVLAIAMVVLGISTWLSMPAFPILFGDETIAREHFQSVVGRPPAAQPVAAPDARSLEDGRVAFRTRYMTASEPKAFAVSAGGAWGISLAATTADDAVTAAMVDCETRRQPSAPPCRLINMNGQGNAPE